jgi:hypothetical protein
MSGDECLIISARFSSHGGMMQPTFWQRLADTLFWLQLGWVVAGLGLMAYLAIKVMPHGKSSRNETQPRMPGPKLVVLGGYRFEITQDPPATRPKVIELPADYASVPRRTR